MAKKTSSIKFNISIAFIVLIFTTFGIIGYFIFSSWEASVDNMVTKMENHTKENIVNQMQKLISNPVYINDVNQNLIKNNIIELKNKSEREKYFAGVIKSSEDEVFSFSYGTENGEQYGACRNDKNQIEIMMKDAETNGKTYYYSTAKDLTADKFTGESGAYDVRLTDWYKIAKEKQAPIFSPIHKHFLLNDLAMSAAYPIYNNNGTFEGVLETQISLSKVNGYLGELVKDTKAEAYIIEKDSGNLVANSLGEPNYTVDSDNNVNRVTFEQINNKPIIQAYENYKKNSSNNFIVNAEYDKIHVTFTEYKNQGLDWLIITAIPQSQFTADIIQSIGISIFLSILVLMIAIVIYIRSTDTVLKPIYNLINTTERFSKGDFLQRAEIFRNDEIGKLSDSFNIMAEQLCMLIYELEEKVKKRTSELEKTNAALKKSEENLYLILDSTAEAIYGIDMKGNCTFCNASCLRMLGYKKPEDLIGKNMHPLIHNKYSDGTPLPMNECKIFEAIYNGEGAHEDGEVLWRADGSCFPVEYFSYPQYRDGKIIGGVVTFIDITERKRSEEEILYLSYHDQLTGLYNRRYFEEELKRLDDEKNFPLTIVMADMNGLKLVNDSLGHAIGDELLKKVAEVITKGCRPNDIAARLGGDEFVILMPETSGYEAEQVIMNIRTMAQKEKVDSVDISISFGYSTKNDNKEYIKDILKKAEDYMYKKKLFEGPSMRGKTINTIIRTLHEKNKREEEHSRRVSELCQGMGKALSLPMGDIEELKTVGLLHDIGKIAIEEGILNKPGKLAEEEWKEIKRHPEIGYRILSTVNDMSEMAEYVLAHHERWDGTGYPKGLKGKKIPLQSRIIAIIDTYDAMTSERRYRRALSQELAIKELQDNAGTQFDPELVKIFIEKVLNKTCDFKCKKVK